MLRSLASVFDGAVSVVLCMSRGQRSNSLLNQVCPIPLHFTSYQCSIPDGSFPWLPPCLLSRPLEADTVIPRGKYVRMIDVRRCVSPRCAALVGRRCMTVYRKVNVHHDWLAHSSLQANEISESDALPSFLGIHLDARFAQSRLRIAGVQLFLSCDRGFP